MIKKGRNSKKLTTGLVSVTFRHLDARQIIDLTVQAGLDGIEWGGDIHVPHGHLATAEEVGKLTREAGLQVISYGSYYNFDEDQLPFHIVLETAVALGAPHIRIWAGELASEHADTEFREQLIRHARVISSKAAKAGVKLSFENHSGTLTDTAASALDLIRKIRRKNIRLYWQPSVEVSIEENLTSLRLLLAHLSNIHVFYWHPTIEHRRALMDGISDWMKYIDIIKEATGSRCFLLEFVKNDDPENLLQDAQTLRMLLTT